MPRVRTKKHGYLGGYTNRGCRCASCTKVYNKYMREYRQKKRKEDSETVCGFGGCEKRGLKIRGLCVNHYNRSLKLVNTGVRTWEEINLAKT